MATHKHRTRDRLDTEGTGWLEATQLSTRLKDRVCLSLRTCVLWQRNLSHSDSTVQCRVYQRLVSVNCAIVEKVIVTSDASAWTLFARARQVRHNNDRLEKRDFEKGSSRLPWKVESRPLSVKLAT